MKLERGFTLLELLVVMVIMGLLISMATLNTSYDKRKDLLSNEAKRLKFFLEAASDEAMFQNKNIGLMVGRYGLKPYAWLPKNQDPTATSSLSSSTDSTETHSWQDYQGRFIKVYDLPDNMEFELEIDSSSINLPHSLELSKEDIQPQFYILSNGEQSISKLNILMDEYDVTASVSGSGLGRFYYKVITDEQ